MSRVIDAFTQFFDSSGSPVENGWLKFIVSGTTSTLKNTYADLDQQIANPNPVQLDGAGRCPNIFGHGNYKVILYENNPVTHLPGTQLQEFDPVISDYSENGSSSETSNFSLWDSNITYVAGQIAVYNGKYYRSISGSNLNNVPDTNPDEWEEITFLRYWNQNVIYAVDDVVIDSGALYFSLQAGNQNHVPLSSPTWWAPVGEGTTLLNWQESGTILRPVVSGYDFGDTSHRVGSIWLNNFANFPTTPASAPSADYEIVNKKYSDDLDAINLKYKGKWSPSTSYILNDVVEDERWLMAANTATEERPSPQPAGKPEWIRELFTPGAFSETSQSEQVLYIGQRYTFTPAFMVRCIRFYLPATATGLIASIWAVYDPTGTGKTITEIMPEKTISAQDTGFWWEIPSGSFFVGTGEVIDFIMVLKPQSGATTFTYQWDYIKSDGDPSAGDIHHQSGSNINQIRVHEQDHTLASRSTYLDNINAGSFISLDDSGVRWEVISSSKTGSVYTFIVTSRARENDDTAADITFTYYTTNSIYYVYNSNLYIGDARVKGFFGTDYDPDDAGNLNENGYGIDVKLQNVIASADWDILSIPPGLGGNDSNAGTIGGYSPEELAVLSENETVTGNYNFTGSTTIEGYTVADFAAIAENETITGDWNFTGEPTIESQLIYNHGNGHMAGFRNRIINGCFRVWQRNSSFGPTSTEQYTADQWYLGVSGSNITIARQDFTAGQTDVPGEPQHYVRWTTATTEDNFYFLTPIEDVRTFAGQTCTFSGWIKTDVAKNLTIRFDQNFGTGGSATVRQSEVLAITTSWQKFTVTKTLGSITGKTIGTDSNLSVYPIAEDSVSGYYDLAQFQFEPGSISTPFEYRPYSVELALCQRYFQKSYRTSEYPGATTTVYEIPYTHVGNTGYAYDSKLLPVVMYKRPSIVFYDQQGNQGRFTVGGSHNVSATSGAMFGGQTQVLFEVQFTGYNNARCVAHYTLEASIY